MDNRRFLSADQLREILEGTGAEVVVTFSVLVVLTDLLGRPHTVKTRTISAHRSRIREMFGGKRIAVYEPLHKTGGLSLSGLLWVRLAILPEPNTISVTPYSEV